MQTDRVIEAQLEEAVPWSGTRDTPGDRRLAQALGWLGIGLGMAEAVAPRRVSRAIGLDDGPSPLVRAFGLREIASGLGILAGAQPAAWLWARVAGDVLDLAMLGAFSDRRATRRDRVTVAAAAVAAVTVLDVVAARRARGREVLRQVAPVASASITINRPADEIYRYWRDLEGLPRIMDHVASVTRLDARRSHWVVRELGRTLEWDAEIVEERPNATLAWRSVPDAPVPHEGRLDLTPAPGRRGTEVRIRMEYRPPGGPWAELLAKALGADPSAQMREDVRRLKQLLETGEIPTTDGQPAGAGR